ncbi:MAG: 4-alpha-glucanotransferase, partial [Treponema sp.]|nr:4-alpha-glucanotransferase [Treponema sp.]
MDTRLIGVVAPLGALRGSEPRAVGEFPDLAEFALFCRDAGIGLIQLLPVNDTGYESSPYFSLTSFALHPLYLRIADLTEAKGFLEAARAIDEEFHARARFPYHKILRAKMGLLREIYAASEAEIAARAEKGGSLAAWIDANSWVRHYAVYR